MIKEDLLKRLKEVRPNWIFIDKIDKIKIKCKCDKGHEIVKYYNDVLKGSGCPICSGKYKYTTEEAIQIMSNYLPGYDFSKFEYKNGRTKSTVICPNGHEFQICFDKVKQGRKCSKCAGHQFNIEDIRKEINKVKPDWKILEFKTKGEKIKYQCPHSHIGYKRYNDLVREEIGCYYCSKAGISNKEQKLFDFIRDNYNVEVEQSNRKIIPSPFSKRYLEIDIYIPDYKLGIEFNGKYWHNEENIKRRGWNSVEEYHNYKTNKCKELGITLIHVDEDKYPNLDKMLKDIKKKIDTYYTEYIVNDLFKYELLK